MELLSGVTNFFGLDIGSTAIRVVQLRGTGASRALERYGFVPIQDTSTISDANTDMTKTAQQVRELLAKIGITTKNVAVNLPSGKVFTTVVDWDKLPPDDLAKALRYQADSIIPTPLAESKMDWAIIGDSPKDPKKIEVLLSSAPNQYIEARLSMLESIGLNVIAFEPDSMALCRALIPLDAQTPHLVLDIGSIATDLIITMKGAPRLVRSIPIGTQVFVRAAMQGLNVDAAQAEQFVFKFGVSHDKLEGKIYAAIIGTIDVLMSEVEKSIKFFQGRYVDTNIDKIIVTGGASSLPELPLYIANRFGMNVEIGNAWRNVSFAAAQQNELAALSNHFAVAVGLAERGPS
jgi:type IV pilus assembly protein PilM